MHGSINELIDIGWMGYMYGWIDIWMDECMDGWIDTWMGRSMDLHCIRCISAFTPTDAPIDTPPCSLTILNRFLKSNDEIQSDLAEHDSSWRQAGFVSDAN